VKNLFRYVSVFLLLFFTLFSTRGYALSLEKKYPNYSYVFHEFDVDESYLYDDDFIAFVSENEKRLRHFYERSLKRGKMLLPMMQGLLLKDGMSDLFIYLSMVESGFLTDAVSAKKAVGLWQFMPATAKHYNLEVCNNYDERYDAMSATSAAITYLNKLHKQFGKWYLAAMAYNCGEGCMKKALRDARTDDLSILIDDNLKYLPKETRLYMKKILLVALIGEKNILDFGSYGSDLIQVEVSGGTSLLYLAKLLSMKDETLLALNRQYKGLYLPKIKKVYKISIPVNKIYAFYLRYEMPKNTVDIKSKIMPPKYLYQLSYHVELGDSLESIAHKYDSKVEAIKRANHLKYSFLTLDALLLIPVSKDIFQRYNKQK